MISLTEAKSHLRVTGSDEDADITIKLQLARAIINDYADSAAYQEAYEATVYTDYQDPAYLKAARKDLLRDSVLDAATLLVLGELYANREADSNPLSPTVKIILERLRVPSFA